MERLQTFAWRTNKGSRIRPWTLVIDLPSDIPWVLVIAAVFLGYGTVFGELLPLGIAYAAALRATGSRESAAPAIFAAVIGTFLAVGWQAALPYAAALAILGFIMPSEVRVRERKKTWLFAALAAFGIKTIIAFLFRQAPGVFLTGITEAAIGVLVYLLTYALLDGWAEEDIAYRETQWLLLALAVTAAVRGRVFGVSIRLLISFCLIAGAARLGGLSVSALLGSGLALAGLLLGESTDYIVLTVLCAILTGVLSGSSFALVMGPALAALLSKGGYVDASIVKLAAASLGAGAAAALIPARFLRHLARIIPGTPSFRQRQASYTERAREVINERMSDQLVVLEELANALEGCDENLVVAQLNGMADVLRTMTREFAPGVSFTGRLEDQILRAFPEVEFRSVTAVQTFDGYEITGYCRRSCATGRFCHEVAEVCTRMNGDKYTVISRKCTSKQGCGFKVAPSPKYKLQVQSAHVASGAISGDNGMVFELSKSKMAVILSDGMGVGMRAHNESRVAIRLLQSMITAGYNVEAAISLVNQVLLMRSRDEIFVTIDLVVVDLYTGKLDFVKIGAAPSFIKRGREVEIIQNQCLPVGILSQIEVERDRRLLKEGEVLIMVTDGVLEARRHIDRKEEWVSRMLQRVDEAQDLSDLARQILSRSINAAHGRVDDDMTVVVAKLARTEEEIEVYRRTS